MVKWLKSQKIQASERVIETKKMLYFFRFGQEKPVYIYRFLAKGTMEEKIYDRQVKNTSWISI